MTIKLCVKTENLRCKERKRFDRKERKDRKIVSITNFCRGNSLWLPSLAEAPLWNFPSILLLEIALDAKRHSASSLAPGDSSMISSRLERCTLRLFAVIARTLESRPSTSKPSGQCLGLERYLRDRTLRKRLNRCEWVEVRFYSR